MVVMTMTTRVQDAVYDVNSSIVGHNIRNENVAMVNRYLCLDRGWFVRSRDRKGEFGFLDVRIDVVIFEKCRKFEVSIRNNLPIREVLGEFIISFTSVRMGRLVVLVICASTEQRLKTRNRDTHQNE